MRLNKKVLIPLIAVVGLGLLAATGYVVNSFVIKADVAEPFSVKYYIIGDAGNYDGTTLCKDIPEGDYQAMPNGQEVDVGGLYPGEGRKFCVRITNAGEGNIPYTISSEVLTGYGNHANCTLAFPDVVKTGTALGETTTIDGHVITVPANAPPVEDCKIEINVARG